MDVGNIKEVALKDMRNEDQFKNEVRFRKHLQAEGCDGAVVPVQQVHVPAGRQEEFRNKEGFDDLVALQASTGPDSFVVTPRRVSS